MLNFLNAWMYESEWLIVLAAAGHGTALLQDPLAPGAHLADDLDRDPATSLEVPAFHHAAERAQPDV